MNTSEIRRTLKDPDSLSTDTFQVLKGISQLHSQEPENPEVQELILRCLEKRSYFKAEESILNDLARIRGLYPYLDQARLDTKSKIAYEFHKPEGLKERGIVFHAPQARVYRELVEGNSVVLSAPTSFGKSLIIDAMIMSNKYKNILIVVPTIALIDETRRRVIDLEAGYKIITHLNQEVQEKNIFILTQERVIQWVDEIDVDFFVIDEFYKLSPGRGDDDRSAILNQVFYKLAKRGIQFYMLGPSIKSVTSQLTRRFECKFIYEPYHTVVSELHPVEYSTEDKYKKLGGLSLSLKGPTIIYCQSPRSASDVASILANNREIRPSENLLRAINWISENYHEEWLLVKALKKRIGIHHGRIPRAIAQLITQAFDNDEIDYLICTSTLIEGVNTKARNIVVFDNNVGREKFDFFTFNNIRGRSGRMFEHFVGHVYLFHEPPQQELPFIDIPAVTQSDDASDSILLQIDEDELNEGSKNRLNKYKDQELLPLKLIREYSSVEPDLLLGFAETLYDMSDPEALRAVSWRGYPEYDQLQGLCELIWSQVNGTRLGNNSIRSAKHLTYKIFNLSDRASIKEMILNQLDYFKQNGISESADDAVQSTLDFLRLWAGFHFPRLVQCIDGVQKHVLSVRELPTGDLTPYANAVESLFLGSSIIALEEYGLPTQISQKLSIPKELKEDLDETIIWLKNEEFDTSHLTYFESSLLESVIESLS